MEFLIVFESSSAAKDNTSSLLSRFRLLAKAVADRLSGRYIELLKSNAKNPQKSLDSAERRKNADFYLVNDIDLKGKTVIIIDDIITSGSSMANAAALVRSLGSKDIVAASLAIAYKDS